MNAALKNNWYPVIFPSFISKEKHYATKIFGEPIVLFRGEDNEIVCLQDRCPHRSAPLSMGTVRNGVISCAYHGWAFTTDGKCVDIPESKTNLKKEIRAVSYTVRESQGIIFIWWGNEAPQFEKLPTYSAYGNKAYFMSEQIVDLDVNYIFHLSNLCDPVHFHLLHDGAIPNINKANYSRLTPESIDDGVALMRYRFHNPEKNPDDVFDLAIYPALTWVLRRYKTNSNEPFSLQMAFHVPVSPNHTRVLWRMYIPANRFPFSVCPSFLSDILAKRLLYGILSEDLEIIKGHFNRSIKYGAPVINRPLTEDQLVLKLHAWEKQYIEKEGSPWFVSWSKNDVCESCNCGKQDIVEESVMEYPPANPTWINNFNWWIRFLQISTTTGFIVGTGLYIYTVKKYGK
jgi:phenylpropionate dioxygenase-like ring-hydroxylating dioxygenase large terminal subunit